MGGDEKRQKKKVNIKRKKIPTPPLDVDMPKHFSQTKEASHWSQRSFIATDMNIVKFSKS